jgi:hypothetical protein
VTWSLPRNSEGNFKIGEHLLAAMDIGAAKGRGDRRNAGKVGKRDDQLLPAHEQHKHACLPPLLTASTSESWCNRCSRARHHLSMECVHDANGMEGTKVRRCANRDNGARAMRTQRTPPRYRKGLEAEKPIAGQLPLEADTVILGSAGKPTA